MLYHLRRNVNCGALPKLIMNCARKSSQQPAFEREKKLLVSIGWSFAAAPRAHLSTGRQVDQEIRSMELHDKTTRSNTSANTSKIYSTSRCLVRGRKQQHSCRQLLIDDSTKNLIGECFLTVSVVLDCEGPPLRTYIFFSFLLFFLIGCKWVLIRIFLHFPY